MAVAISTVDTPCGYTRCRAVLVGELLFGYDILLIDMFGVIWSGVDVFPAAPIAMERLVSSGREVIILSNASLLAEDVAKKYEARGLFRGVHFSDFVTSGSAMGDILASGNLRFKSCQFPKKYFLHGAANDAIFAKSALERTENLDEADFVYLSAVRFSDAERERMSDEMRRHLYVAQTGGPHREWDSTSVDPYIPQMEIFLKKKKPIAIANPDKFAICAVLETPDAAEFSPKAVAKQGLIAEAYEKMGGEVLAIGKPFPQVYRHALGNFSKKTGKTLDDIRGKRIAMVGDSIDTDILGAKNASGDIGCKIDGILVLTGIFAGDARKDADGSISPASMDEIFSERNIRPDHIVSALATDGTVIF